MQYVELSVDHNVANEHEISMLADKGVAIGQCGATSRLPNRSHQRPVTDSLLIFWLSGRAWESLGYSRGWGATDRLQPNPIAWRYARQTTSAYSHSRATGFLCLTLCLYVPVSGCMLCNTLCLSFSHSLAPPCSALPCLKSCIAVPLAQSCSSTLSCV